MSCLSCRVVSFVLCCALCCANLVSLTWCWDLFRWCVLAPWMSWNSFQVFAWRICTERGQLLSGVFDRQAACWFCFDFLYLISIDHITIPSQKGKGQLRRVSEVFDCWFESGRCEQPSLRVIKFKFSLQSHQKYHITHMKNLAFHSFLKWKMIILPILTISLIHSSLEGWENVLFELGVLMSKISVSCSLLAILQRDVTHAAAWSPD